MSIRALNWAFDQRGMHATSKLVLIAIANHADDNGYAWPGIDGIAERWGMSPRTVSRHVHLLSMDEYVTVAPRFRSNGSQTSNAYQLNMTPLTDCHPPHDNSVTPRTYNTTNIRHYSYTGGLARMVELTGGAPAINRA